MIVFVPLDKERGRMGGCFNFHGLVVCLGGDWVGEMIALEREFMRFIFQLSW